jgi:hypothetical protein
LISSLETTGPFGTSGTPRNPFQELMMKVNFRSGCTTTEAVSANQIMLVILPETIRPARMLTYAGRFKSV